MNPWISAARPRTLPLALSSIFMGSFLAAYIGKFNWAIFAQACMTTIALQVLSNFANDYGDTQNGADSADRVGPARAVQSGEISQQSMWKAIWLAGFLSLILGVALLYVSFKNEPFSTVFSFFALGVLCILAAYFYTAGKKPYGYAGLGDLSVFLFFGLVGVLGSAFLYTKVFMPSFIWPAITCGALAVGVLNLNNIRDIDTDARAGKNTIPVRIGRKNAILYQWVLLFLAIISMLIFALSNHGISWWFLGAFPLILRVGILLNKMPNPDPLLKQLALTSLITVLLSGVSMLV